MCLKSNEHQSIGIEGAKYQQKWGIMFHLCFCTGIVFVVSILALDSFYSFYYSWLKLSGNGSTQTQVTLPSCPGSSSNHTGCCFLSAGSKLQCFISKLDIHNWWRCYAYSYCNMNRACGGFDSGWMRVAMLDMRDRSSCMPSSIEGESTSWQPWYWLLFKYHVPCMHVRNYTYDQLGGK